MFLFCLVFAMFCARLFICALWSPAGKGLTSWLSFVVSSVSLSLSHWYPGSGVVLDCIDSWSLHHYLLLIWQDEWVFWSNVDIMPCKFFHYRICISCLINMHEQLPSGAIDLNISMSLHLHPFFVYASIEGSGESVQMYRLNWALCYY